MKTFVGFNDDQGRVLVRRTEILAWRDYGESTGTTLYLKGGLDIDVESDFDDVTNAILRAERGDA